MNGETVEVNGTQVPTEMPVESATITENSAPQQPPQQPQQKQQEEKEEQKEERRSSGFRTWYVQERPGDASNRGLGPFEFLCRHRHALKKDGIEEVKYDGGKWMARLTNNSWIEKNTEATKGFKNTSGDFYNKCYIKRR